MLLLFIHSVVSDCLPPNRLQHTRLPCPSPSPRICSNSSPLSRWCYPTISTSVAPFSSCTQESFTVSWWVFYGRVSYTESVFESGGRNIGASASAAVLPMTIQFVSFRIDWFDLLESPLQHHSLKASILQSSAFFMVQLSHPYMTTGETIALTRWLLGKWCLWFLIHCLGLS